jgi:hypothetical protein
MSKAFLNQHGLRKLLPYLESIVPGIKDKAIIEGNHLKIQGEDFDILVRVPITEALLPSQAAMPTQASASTAAAPTPTSQLPSSKAVGKGPEPEVSQLGKAGAKKDEEETLQQLIIKLSKHFPTRQEFDKYLQQAGTKPEGEKADVADTFERIAALLKK